MVSHCPRDSKVVLSLSGGLDSSVLLAHLLNAGNTVYAGQFQYGSKHNAYEAAAYSQVVAHYQHLYPEKLLPLPVVDLSSVFAGGHQSSALLSGGAAVPDGHYEEETMRQTVVPGRNLIFIAVMASKAEQLGAGYVCLGVHAGDHFIYPDCRETFIYDVDAAVETGTGGKVRVTAPFIASDKTRIVQRGLELEVPFEKTRTCYKPQRVACGTCGSCQERLEAFRNNQAADLLEYQSRDLLPKKGG